ncbi:DUF6188 family protein [Streptomyces marincola]|uniref:DUF6188 family protein n=1 Tax=Streptomyces marincola TaxID=2878388 RepID=UPI001CF33A8C|nr:DUF6188 family protein [Streptomyces marincola]UCM88902.1 DUF6188 family protein [Streptomyces marincola]
MKVPRALVGAGVERTAFDYQVRLLLRTYPASMIGAVDAELVVETPFLIRPPGDSWHELTPGSGVSLAPVLGLFGQSITTVDIYGRGMLTLDFGDGASLRVPPDAQFESWRLDGHGVTPITVGPGGEDRWEA